MPSKLREAQVQEVLGLIKKHGWGVTSSFVLINKIVNNPKKTLNYMKGIEDGPGRTNRRARRPAGAATRASNGKKR
jgi:hypothetical protein